MGFGVKRDFDYYEGFEKMGELALKASKQLLDLTNEYTDVVAKADLIHDTEHAADTHLHTVVAELSSSFITPIDREDILQITNKIDDIVDAIEDVANMYDMFSIEIIRPEAKVMVETIAATCSSLLNAISAFRNFKKSSDKLNVLVIEVNTREEEADRFYRKTIKSLYQKETNPIEISKWKEIFDVLENTMDSCADVANLLEAMSIKNS